MTRQATEQIPARRHNKTRASLSLLALAAALAATGPASAVDLSYLQGLLATTPQGGWVQVNSNKYSDAWATVAQGGLPDGGNADPASIITAWSSFAWDSVNGQLLLWGGGHANYLGNEVYAWNATTGAWGRGSLPSRLDRDGNTSTYFVTDDAAPQAAHTYDNSLFAPVNGVFVTFGGAAYNSGGAFVVGGSQGACAHSPCRRRHIYQYTDQFGPQHCGTVLWAGIDATRLVSFL